MPIVKSSRRWGFKPFARLKRKWVITSLSAVTVLLLGGACLMVLGSKREQSFGGQVIAQVGGEEVTVQDLQAEARAQGQPYVSELAPTLAAAVVDRLLMARKARELNLDRTPEFPSDKRRAEAQVLADQVARRLPQAPAPTDSQIAAYENAHPEAFSERQRLVLKTVTYPGDIVLGSAGSEAMSQVRAVLQSRGIAASESLKIVLSDDLPLVLLKALRSAPGGTVFWHTGAHAVAIQLVSAEPAPLGSDAATAKAIGAIGSSERQDALRNSLTAMKRSWLVRYAPGFRFSSEHIDQPKGELR